MLTELMLLLEMICYLLGGKGGVCVWEGGGAHICVRELELKVKNVILQGL